MLTGLQRQSTSVIVGLLIKIVIYLSALQFIKQCIITHTMQQQSPKIIEVEKVRESQENQPTQHFGSENAVRVTQTERGSVPVPLGKISSKTLSAIES